MDKSSFSSTWSEAREKFLAVCKDLDACEVTSFPIVYDRSRYDARDTVDLFVDAAWLGPSPHEADSVFISTSGVHGSEGHAGSAIQISWLLSKPVLPSGTAACVLHIINPYGMHFLRRWNENGVDLNRNWDADAVRSDSVPDGYDALSATINATSVVPYIDPRYYALYARVAISPGIARATEAVATGQYRYPEKLFFGGNCIESGPSQILAYLSSKGLTSKRVMHHDIHTGLGTSGFDTLLAFSEYFPERIRGHDAFEATDGGELEISGQGDETIGYRPRGSINDGIMGLCDPEHRASISTEFGTYSPFFVARALRSENSYHLYSEGTLSLEHYSKRMLITAFYPATTAWHEKVLRRGGAIMDKLPSSLCLL